MCENYHADCLHHITSETDQVVECVHLPEATIIKYAVNKVILCLEVLHTNRRVQEASRCMIIIAQMAVALYLKALRAST